jgi:hypothetical protein
MIHLRTHLGLAVVAMLLAVACLDPFGQEHLGPLEIEVRYHGTCGECPLEALILHSTVDNYDEVDNLLVAPLEVDEAMRFTEIPSGKWYVTVIRKQRPLPDSPRMALTTAEPVFFFNGRYEILVFDDFFRLVDPVRSDDATD